MLHTQRGNVDPSKTPGGLAVLGVMFKVGSHNAALQPLIDAVVHVKEHNDTTLSHTLVDDVNVEDLFPFDRISDYLTYAGSLTTPGCYESVNWLLPGTPMSISAVQLAELRSAEHSPGHIIGHNYRPTQPLNNRTVSATSGGVQKVLSMSSVEDSHCNKHAVTPSSGHAASSGYEPAATYTSTTTAMSPDRIMVSESVLRAVVASAIPMEMECKNHDPMLGMLIATLILAVLVFASICIVIVLRRFDHGSPGTAMDSSPASTANLLGKDDLRSKMSKISDTLGHLGKMVKHVDTAAEQSMMNGKALSSVDERMVKLLESVEQTAKHTKATASKKELNELSEKIYKLATMTGSLEQQLGGNTASTDDKTVAELEKRMALLLDLVRMQQL